MGAILRRIRSRLFDAWVFAGIVGRESPAGGRIGLRHAFDIAFVRPKVDWGQFMQELRESMEAERSGDEQSAI